MTSRRPRARLARPVPAGRAVIVYVIGVFALAALCAPALYHAARHAALLAPVLEPLACHPLHRYLQRLLLVFAVAALPTLLRTLGLRRWRDLGLSRPRAQLRRFVTGAAVGATTILVAAAVPLAAGARVWDPLATPGRIVLRVLTALAVAPLVALLEEFLFRGVLDGGLRRARASAGALAASSAFYAAMHFLARPATPPVVHWDSGFAVLAGMLGGLANLTALVPAFLTLWIVGSYLGAIYHRAGTLLANAGVHAGGIFVLQLYGLVTTEARGMHSRLWGTGRLVDGWVALGVVLAAGGVAHALRPRTACRPLDASRSVPERDTAVEPASVAA